MQAIVTRFHGATNTKPARISATSASGLRIVRSYDHALTSDDAHHQVARALCDKYGWPNELLGGGLSDGEEVWVMIPIDQQLVRKLRRSARKPIEHTPPSPDELGELRERADLFDLMQHHLDEETDLGDASPIDNVIRAAFAAEALDTFTRRTHGGNDPRTMDHGDLQDAIGDLIGDLLHLARLVGVDPENIQHVARGHFDYELSHESHPANVA